jgi:hypothetical protein
VETLKIVSGFLPRTMCAVVLPFKRLLTLLALDPLVEFHDETKTTTRLGDTCCRISVRRAATTRHWDPWCFPTFAREQ